MENSWDDADKIAVTAALGRPGTVERWPTKDLGLFGALKMIKAWSVEIKSALSECTDDELQQRAEQATKHNHFPKFHAQIPQKKQGSCLEELVSWETWLKVQLCEDPEVVKIKGTFQEHLDDDDVEGPMSPATTTAETDMSVQTVHSHYNPHWWGWNTNPENYPDNQLGLATPSPVRLSDQEVRAIDEKKQTTTSNTKDD